MHLNMHIREIDFSMCRGGDRIIGQVPEGKSGMHGDMDTAECNGKTSLSDVFCKHPNTLQSVTEKVGLKLTL